MWSYNYKELIKPRTIKKRKNLLIDRRFQLKYSALVLLTVFLSGLIAFLPLYYNIKENYQLFIELAYLNSPNIVENLQDEHLWMNSLFLFAPIVQMIFIYIVMLKLTAKIVGPLEVLKKHMKMLRKGQWDSPSIKVRENDEFQDVIDSYNSFLQSFRENLKMDLSKIKKLNISKNSGLDYKIWREFINARHRQLGLPDPLKSVDASTDAVTPGSRRVS